MSISITVPYPPSVGKYWRMAVIHGQPRWLISREGREYKKRMADLLTAGRHQPLQGALSLTATAYRPRKVGDLDNVLKALLDALKGHLYDDDSQLVELHLFRADDKANPRVELKVEVASVTAQL